MRRGDRVRLLPGSRVGPAGVAPAHGARGIVLGAVNAQLLIVAVEGCGQQLCERRNLRPAGAEEELGLRLAGGHGGSLVIALLLALLACLVQPQLPPPAFWAAVLGDCQAVIRPGEFMGCEQAHPGADDAAYAGLLWQEGRPSLQTGP